MHLNRDSISAAVRKIQAVFASKIRDNDRLFIQRIYGEGLDKYIDRLSSIGFSGHQHVLDAGCGYGQWSLALAGLNQSVSACDISQIRVNFLGDLKRELAVPNLEFRVSGIDALPYGDASFDAIFCYSVLYLVDHDKALREFKRVLRPGGKLYICTNSLGWYLYNLENNHNPAADFDPKEVAAKAIENTINVAHGKNRDRASHIIIPGYALSFLLESLGFHNISLAPEGELSPSVPSFFLGEYRGLEAVYEIICEK
jgi:SAM-dependent methyltransferase